jgi:glycosidase
MVRTTPISLRNSVMYSIYVRSHSAEGNFKGVAKDLERIKSLGTDIVWFLPIHAIGEKNKKGSLGCPYSISDFRSVNPVCIRCVYRAVV